jgi:hypothetical protein
MEKLLLLDTSEEIEIINFLSSILSNEKLTSPIDDIWELIYKNKVTTSAINEILNAHGIQNIDEIKRELIELTSIIVRSFIQFHSMNISQNEVNFVRKLMCLFAIDGKEFYKFRKNEVAKFLQPELEKLYFKMLHTSMPTYEAKMQNSVNNPWSGWDSKEALYKVKLQEIFGLSYDHFLEFANIEDKKAIEKGANLIDLDTVYFIHKR